MQDNRTISLCIPTWERTDMVIEAFKDVYSDERISEIILVDDASRPEVYEDLKSLIAGLPKVKLYQNSVNLDCYRNKHRAIELANNDWCVLLDSDNAIDKKYIDKLFDYEWERTTIYTPDFAMPHFDFSKYGGMLLTRENIATHIDKPLLETMLNASNFFINRSEYLKVWDGSIDPVTSDSIYFCLKWLESGNKIQVVNNLTYLHAIHSGSHYKNNVHRTPNGFHESILNKLKHLV